MPNPPKKNATPWYRQSKFIIGLTIALAGAIVGSIITDIGQILPVAFGPTDISDFVISINPDTDSVFFPKDYEGLNITIPLSTEIKVLNPRQIIKPYSYPVYLEALNVPSGVYLDFNDKQGVPPFSSVMSLSVTNDCIPGDYTITIQGEGGEGRKRNATYILNVETETTIEVGEIKLTKSSDPNEKGIEMIYVGNGTWKVPERVSNALELAQKGLDSYNSENYEVAIKYYDEAIDSYPEYEDAWFNKGVALERLGRYEEAIKCLNKSIELNPKYKDAWYTKGAILESDLNKHNDAIQAFNEAIKIDPLYIKSWLNKGVALGGLGNYDDAIKCFDEVIRIDPGMAEGWYNKGYTLSESGRPDIAIKYYDRAIDINPQFAIAWSEKGHSLVLMGNYEDAIKSIEKAIDLNPKDKYAWSLKASVLYYQGRYDEALQAIDRAIELDPQNAMAWYNKGVTLKGLSRTNEADAAFAKAKELGIYGQ